MSADEYFYSMGGQRYGPVSRDELLRLAEERILLPTDSVWKPGMATWVRADDPAVWGRADDPGVVADVTGASPPPPALETPSVSDSTANTERQEVRRFGGPPARPQLRSPAIIGSGPPEGMKVAGIILIVLGCIGVVGFWFMETRYADHQRPQAELEEAAHWRHPMALFPTD